MVSFCGFQVNVKGEYRKIICILYIYTQCFKENVARTGTACVRDLVQRNTGQDCRSRPERRLVPRKVLIAEKLSG